MMKTAVRAIEKETGKGKVVVLAPTAEASRKVLREEGFSNADTVAKFLGDKDLQKSIAKGFLWVDEAGLISAPDMNKLFEIAKAQKARVILSGDTAQHRSISRGEAFAMLKRHAGLKPARLSNILRQSSNPTYRDAVANLSVGNIGAGFQALDRMGAIKSTSKGYEEVVSSHQKAREEGKSLIVVSPTHKEGRAVTDALRASLEATGELRGRGRTFRTLDNLHLTDAQKKHGGFIKRGQVLRFHRSTSGFSSGDKAKVVVKGFGWILAIDKKRLRLALVWTGTKKARGAFTVNEEAHINVKRGDLIRMTANTRAVSALPQFKKHIRGDRSPTRVNNGAVHRVKATFGYQILLDNGFIFDARSGAFTHGYVTTSQASQGRTADKVIIVQNSSSYANMKSQFYVSASRGRSEIEIFTDNKARLLKSVKRTTQDVSASELVQNFGKRKHMNYGNTRT